MGCVYCGRDGNMSREHIFSKSLLDLFPECYLTFGVPDGVVHEADPVIKDVCADCNSKISYIDTYIRNLVRDNFVQKFTQHDTPVLHYDYTLMQKALLKQAYNDIRAHHQDDSFFDEEIRNYILNDSDKTPKSNVIIMAGFGVNTTPVPDMAYGNMKLEMVNSPVLFEDTVVEFIDYINWSYTLRENPGRFIVPGSTMSYSFRFNSGRFLLFCFDKAFDKIEQQRIVLKSSYPFAVLDDKGETELPLCTSYFNYHHPEMIFVSWDPAFELSHMAEGANEDNEKLKELQARFDAYEKQLANDHKRK